MSNNNLTKARVARLLSDISAAGLTPPSFSDDVSPAEREAALKAFKAEHIKKTPKHDLRPKKEPVDLGVQTDNSANEAIMASMQSQINALQAILSKVTATDPQSQFSPDAFAQAMKVVLDQQRKGDVELGEVQEGYVPPDDVLDKPITYFTPQQNEYLSFRWEGGLRVTPPNGKKYLKFDNKFRWAVQTVNGPKIRSIATYVCRSKSERDWVERHPKFGRTVFKDSGRAIEASEHTEWTIQYNKNFQGASNMSDARLPTLAHSLGLPTRSDILPDQYRSMIAEAQTKAYFEQIKTTVQAQIVDREADALLVSSLAK